RARRPRRRRDLVLGARRRRRRGRRSRRASPRRYRARRPVGHLQRAARRGRGADRCLRARSLSAVGRWRSDRSRRHPPGPGGGPRRLPGGDDSRGAPGGPAPRQRRSPHRGPPDRAPWRGRARGRRTLGRGRANHHREPGRDAAGGAMNLDFLSGALAAWAVAYSSVALFFLLAHLWARQEREYLLFGLLLFALAVMSAGLALAFQPQGPPPHLLGNRVAMTGAILAVAFQLQFALRYSSRGRPWYVWPLVAVALGMLAWTWSASWGVSASPEEPNVLLMRLHPNLGTAFSTFVLTGAVLSALLLLDTYRRGKLEAVLLLVAVGLVAAACVHDVFVLHTPARRASEFVSPHVLWVYVVALAATLLLHYRGAEGRLAEAASSLRARTEELRRSHAELEKVQSELVRKEQLAAVGELAASIAHEVRNPLAVIV